MVQRKWQTEIVKGLQERKNLENTENSEWGMGTWDKVELFGRLMKDVFSVVAILPRFQGAVIVIGKKILVQMC